MHEEALEAATAKKWDRALQLWQDARNLNPTGKYALNACLVLEHGLKRPLDAWPLCAEAVMRGVSESHSAKLTAVLERLEAALSPGHARLIVTASPAGAAITRNGSRWAPPRDLWTREPSSVIRVTAPGHEPHEETIAHARGAATRREIALKLAPARLTVLGGPAGATVRVDDRAVGVLPLAAIGLPPGAHSVVVTAPVVDEPRDPE